MKRIAALAILSLFTALLHVGPAGACQQTQPLDYRDDYNHSDAAFIGRLIETHDVPDDPYMTDFTFEVVESFKGVLVGETVVVRGYDPGCGNPLGGSAGYESPVVATNDGDGLRQIFSIFMTEGVLRRASQPLPDPDGHGEAKMLAGGSFGETRVLALDKRGRTVGYGYGEGNVRAMSLCPGNRNLVEFVQDDDGSGLRVAVRRVSDLSVLIEVQLSEGSFIPYVYARMDVECLTRDGAESLVSGETFRDGRVVTRVLGVSGTEANTVYRSRHLLVDLGRKGVAVHEEGRLYVHGFDSDKTRIVANFHSFGDAGFDPTGVILAGTGTFAEGRPVVFADGPDGFRKEPLEGGGPIGRVRWFGERLFVSGGSVFDLQLDRVARGVFNPKYVADGEPSGPWFYTTSWGELTRDDLNGRLEPVEINTFFSQVTLDLEAIPGGAEVNAPPHS